MTATTRQLLADTLGWGFALWLFGYVLGFLLYAVVPVAAIGWVITPVATLVTVWVVLRKIPGRSLARYLLVALVWTAIAIAGDYLGIVKALHPPDGYYKPDVYLYYTLTFILPLALGFWSQRTAGH